MWEFCTNVPWHANIHVYMLFVNNPRLLSDQTWPHRQKIICSRPWFWNLFLHQKSNKMVPDTRWWSPTTMSFILLEWPLPWSEHSQRSQADPGLKENLDNGLWLTALTQNIQSDVIQNPSFIWRRGLKGFTHLQMSSAPDMASIWNNMTPFN